MSAGLPGTGIAGAFYLTLIFWMLLRGLGKNSPRNCTSSSGLIWKMVALSIVMIAVAIGEIVFLHSVLQKAVLYLPSLASFTKPSSTSMKIAMVSMPFLLLLLLMAGIQGLRLAMRVKGRVAHLHPSVAGSRAKPDHSAVPATTMWAMPRAVELPHPDILTTQLDVYDLEDEGVRAVIANSRKTGDRNKISPIA